MRVLIILKYIPSAKHHQKSDLLKTTIEAHLMEGHEVVLLSTGKKAEHDFDEIKIRFSLAYKAWDKVTQKFLKISSSSLNANLVKSVAKYHRIKPIDIIFAECNSNYPAFHAYNLDKALGIPYVLREHRLYRKPKSEISKLYLEALNAARAVVAVSPGLAKTMKDLSIREDLGCIPNALSDEFFEKPASTGGYRKWAGDAFLFAGWTRWRHIKRVDLLLEAFNQIIAGGFKAKLIIAGPLEPEENYRWVKKYINQKGLSEKVWLTGEIARSEIHSLAYDCDCCVVSSDYETFGLPALEAMAAGTPVVTTQCSGPEFLIESKKLGRVVERASGAALFEGMADVYKNHDNFNREEIKRSAYERFSRTAVAGMFTDLYKELLRV